MLCRPEACFASAPIRDNLPFSNEKGEGFENKLAELIAEKLATPARLYLVAAVAGHVPSSTSTATCDLLMGYAQGTGLIEDTNPYYRTSYVLIYRQDDRASPASRVCPTRGSRGRRIGILARTPPASILAMQWADGERKAVRGGQRRRERGKPTMTSSRDRLGRARRRHVVGAGRRLLRAKRARCRSRSCRWSRRTAGPARSTASPWACARTSRSGSIRSTS